MILLLLLLTSSTLTNYGVNGCLCRYHSLHELFCYSDFVIEVRVKDVAELRSLWKFVYEVEILETYKATDKAKKALELNLLVTPSIQGLCGAKLEKNQVAVVGAGWQNGQPRITSCELLITNSSKIEAQRSNLRENFAKFCPSV